MSFLSILMVSGRQAGSSEKCERVRHVRRMSALVLHDQAGNRTFGGCGSGICISAKPQEDGVPAVTAMRQSRGDAETMASLVLLYVLNVRRVPGRLSRVGRKITVFC